jgi:hypothetical protein
MEASLSIEETSKGVEGCSILVAVIGQTHIQQPEQWETRPIRFLIENQLNVFGKHVGK